MGTGNDTDVLRGHLADERKYYDSDGCECSLDTLCRREPAWAANRIRVLERVRANAVEDLMLSRELLWEVDRQFSIPFDSLVEIDMTHLADRVHANLMEVRCPSCGRKVSHPGLLNRDGTCGQMLGSCDMIDGCTDSCSDGSDLHAGPERLLLEGKCLST